MTKSKTATIIELATQLSQALEHRNRTTTGADFVCLKDDSPQWMTDAIHSAHGSKLPDDHIYRFCELAADAIADCTDDADEDAIREAIDEIEPPFQTAKQMDWFSENWEYCDQAIEEGLWESHPENDRTARAGLRRHSGQTAQVTDLVAIGMGLHIREVASALLEALAERADELDTE